jgi:hypothetical protein
MSEAGFTEAERREMLDELAVIGAKAEQIRAELVSGEYGDYDEPAGEDLIAAFHRADPTLGVRIDALADLRAAGALGGGDVTVRDAADILLRMTNVLLPTWREDIRNE